jgi:hypothetical protein
MTRDEIRDEIWDALMNRMDIDVSTTDLADAALERLESLGLIAQVGRNPKGGGAKRGSVEDEHAVPKGCAQPQSQDNIS